MADYKSMYYHLAGRMATAVEVLETSTNMQKAMADMQKVLADELAALAEKLKHAQQATEDMFIENGEDVS